MNKKALEPRQFTGYSVIRQNARLTGQRRRKKAERARNHVFLNVLQRWQNYTNIAPQILVDG
jgi:predicted RNA-binding protein with PIN domain